MNTDEIDAALNGRLDLHQRELHARQLGNGDEIERERHSRE